VTSLRGAIDACLAWARAAAPPPIAAAAPATAMAEPLER